MSQVSMDPGQVIFHEGDPGDCAYLIERGCVEIVIDDGAKTLSRLGPG